MQSKLIKISRLKNNTGQIEGVPKNPRILKDDKYKKLVKSIQEDPEMLQLREVIAYDNDGELVVIAGNMRLKACKEAGLDEVPTKILPKDTPDDWVTLDDERQELDNPKEFEINIRSQYPEVIENIESEIKEIVSNYDCSISVK